MPWTCPTCGRLFRNTNQEHSCAVRSIESHLENKPEAIVELFQHLHNFIFDLSPDIRVSPVKNAILYARESSFIAIKTKKDRIGLEIILDRLDDIFPVYKTVQVTKYKFCHFILLDSPDDFTNQIKDWLVEAYEVTKSKK